MKTKTAIKKAVENGYEERKEPIETPTGFRNRVLLDPEFWKALGKGLGWKSEEGGAKSKLYSGGIVGLKGDATTRIGSWKHHWHKLIDHLANGGSVEQYFKQI